MIAYEGSDKLFDVITYIDMPRLEISPACMLFAVRLAHWSTSWGRGCLLKASGSMASCLPNQLCERVNLETPGSAAAALAGGVRAHQNPLRRSQNRSCVPPAQPVLADPGRNNEWLECIQRPSSREGLWCSVEQELCTAARRGRRRARPTSTPHACGRDWGGHSSQPGWVLARRTAHEIAPAWQ